VKQQRAALQAREKIRRQTVDHSLADPNPKPGQGNIQHAVDGEDDDSRGGDPI